MFWSSHCFSAHFNSLFLLSLSHSLFLSLLPPPLHSCTTADTHILSVSLLTLCFLSFPLNVFVAPIFMRWRLYSSSFYRLFFSFTLFILHLHTPSFLIIFSLFPFVLILSHPFISSLLLVFILVSSPLHCLLFFLLLFLQWKLRHFTVSERVNVMSSVSRRVTSWRWVWVCMCVHAIVHCEHLDETIRIIPLQKILDQWVQECSRIYFRLDICVNRWWFM